MKKKNILIIGATSGIAEAVARRYAATGCNLCLVARSQQKLDVLASDLTARGAAMVRTMVWEGSDAKALPAVVAFAWDALQSVDVALIAHGTLPDQQRAEKDLVYAMEHFRINGESALLCMLALSARFEAQQGGSLAVIGSVAGDRGRPSNYLYGAAKSAVEACASGLRAKLYKAGVHVLLIKPGFVATAMTADLNLPAKLTATPERVAENITSAIESKVGVLYTPWFWRFIMLIIRQIPDVIFKRLSL
jgi:decaprenylphospho-beta-D-erythro-pentofuranosid-2-ulose 2-reductase